MGDVAQAPLLPDARLVRLPDWYYCSFRHGARRFVSRRTDLIFLAERDGIPQVAPILLVFGGRPDEVRARIGKGLWRRVHHSPLQANVHRAVIKLMTRLDFATIMAIPESALRETVGQCKTSGESAVSVAAWIARGRNEMREAVMLARDTVRMNGAPNPKWSLRRLREEHDRLARDLAMKEADPRPWAEPWTFEHDGFHFRRLISNGDFAAEGRVMRHCIAGYASRARRGDEIAFAIFGAERASVSFARDGHVEIKGRFNRSVSHRCHRAAIAMWAAFDARPTPADRPETEGRDG